MISISKNADPNYLATVIECPELKNHPNADRLEITNVFGGDVIVAKGQYQKGELLCYFPVESCISQKFLAWANLLDKAESNADGKTKGFFSSKNGRVRAIKLREIPSQGFLFKVSKLAEYYGVKESVFKLGESFDTINDDLLVKKYVSGERKSGNQNESKKRIPKWIENTVRIFPLPIRKRLYTGINYFYDKNKQGIGSLIVDGHWAFHYKTEGAGRNIHILSPEDTIIITEKLHGANGVYGNILCKKPFNIFRYFGKKIGFSVEETEHKLVYSSRNILKNRRDGKYTDDVWGNVAQDIDGKLPKDIILYGELIGWSSDNKCIQKNYDYSLPNGKVGFRVFRGVRNTQEGKQIELSWDELVEICEYSNLEMVPIHYKGLVKDLFDIHIDDTWRDKFLSNLAKKFFKNKCHYCKNSVVNEGVVLRIESSERKTVLKYKNPSFLVQESSARDINEENIDEEN